MKNTFSFLSRNAGLSLAVAGGLACSGCATSTLWRCTATRQCDPTEIVALCIDNRQPDRRDVVVIYSERCFKTNTAVTTRLRAYRLPTVESGRTPTAKEGQVALKEARKLPLLPLYSAGQPVANGQAPPGLFATRGADPQQFTLHRAGREVGTYTPPSYADGDATTWDPTFWAAGCSPWCQPVEVMEVRADTNSLGESVVVIYRERCCWTNDNAKSRLRAYALFATCTNQAAGKGPAFVSLKQATNLCLVPVFSAAQAPTNHLTAPLLYGVTAVGGCQFTLYEAGRRLGTYAPKPYLESGNRWLRPLLVPFTATTDTVIVGGLLGVTLLHPPGP